MSNNQLVYSLPIINAAASLYEGIYVNVQYDHKEHKLYNCDSQNL